MGWKDDLKEGWEEGQQEGDLFTAKAKKKAATLMAGWESFAEERRRRREESYEEPAEKEFNIEELAEAKRQRREEAYAAVAGAARQVQGGWQKVSGFFGGYHAPRQRYRRKAKVKRRPMLPPKYYQYYPPGYPAGYRQPRKKRKAKPRKARYVVDPLRGYFY